MQACTWCNQQNRFFNDSQGVKYSFMCIEGFSHIRLRVFAWVFLRIVAGYRLKLIFVTVVPNEMKDG